MKTKTIKWFIPFAIVLIVVGSASCKKDYYKDSGKLDPTFDGSVLDYLKSKKGQFDSIVKIIHLAGMDDVFQNEQITFFAPSDSILRNTLSSMNFSLELQGYKRIDDLSQLSAQFWKSQIALYTFRGAKSLTDYPQIDFTNLSAFSGGYFKSYDGHDMNIGVDFQDAAGVRYAGYRQLNLSYLISPATPRDARTWYTQNIASANIKPRNGYVHALSYTNMGLVYMISEGNIIISIQKVPADFGFSFSRFFADAIASGIK